ncbi:hypothetical protein RTE01_04420 [Raoultella terrigena]|uniref:Uncharacterized protein n=1 Tax=Raoultella terrigena TaxID=577 RepID=A0A485BWN9_RAOTE|nr:hypothetical protein RTE01_04420 [Raoultella terrigena]VFS72969.1 Uncharacterised protein [Raoultella terrigena]
MQSIPGLSARDVVGRGFEKIANGWAKIVPPAQNQLVISALTVVDHCRFSATARIQS